MKRYEIIRSTSGQVSCTVRHDGDAATLLKHIVWHSPTGFETGYGGSGPADLALSILADWLSVSEERMQAAKKAWTLSPHLAPHLAILMHQMFKADFIARHKLEPGQSYQITGEEIAKWLEANKR